jgi:hypothetical protein
MKTVIPNKARITVDKFNQSETFSKNLLGIQRGRIALTADFWIKDVKTCQISLNLW